MPVNTTLKLPVNPTYTDRRIVNTYNSYGDKFESLAQLYGLSVPGIVATFIVESGGAGFGPQGKVLIRFENHIFYSYWGNKNPNLFFQHFSFNGVKKWLGHTFNGQPFHGNQVLEHAVLDYAYTLNPYAAMCSISMGGPQIMGFNHKAAGYATPQLMYADFQKGMANQIAGFFRFIASNKNRIDSLAKEDWRTFALLYNGSGQADTYARLIKTTVDRFNFIAEQSPKMV